MSSRSTQIIGGPDREHAHVDTSTNALLVKVVNPGGASSNVNIAQVGGTNIGSTVPISDGGGSITVDGSLTATFGGFASTANSTTTALGSNATFTGTWEDLRDYATLSVTVYANVASATGGLQFQWSGDGVTEDESEDITISASHPGRAMAFNVRGRYFRIRYTNGATAQTTFRLNTVYRPSGSGTNNHTITEVLEDTTLAIVTRSVIAGQTTGGGGGYHNVKVTPSGALTAEVNDGGGSLTVDGTVAATQSGAWTVSVNEPVSIDDNGGSITVDGTVAVSSVAGTVVVGDGGGSLTVDGTVGISGTVTVADGGGSLTVDGSVSVSNFPAVQPVSDNGGSLTVDGSVSITGTVDTGLGKAEDAVHVSGDTGVMALAIRRDTASSPSGTNGDYTPLSVDALGCLRVVIADGEDATPMSTFLQSDTVSLNAAAPALALLVSAPKSYDNTSYATDETHFARMDNAGYLQISGLIRDADNPQGYALNIVRVDEPAGATAWTGTWGITKRVNAPSTAASSANGDFQGLISDAEGRLWVDAVQYGTWTVDVNDGQLNANLYVGASPVTSTNPVYVREAGVTTVALSGSTRGRPIQIAATSSPGTTLHTATTTTGQLDRVYIYLTNTSASSVLVSIEFGTTGTGSEVDIIVPPNDTVLAVDGSVLGGAATDTITAYAATTNVINAFGRVERLS